MGTPTDGTDSDKDMRAEILKYRLERQNAAQTYNGEMSKWILASLILVNGAPFLLVSKDLPGFATVLVHNAWHFTVAIALAILCGFSAWLNTGMREAVAGYQVEKLISNHLKGSKQAVALAKAEATSTIFVKIAYASALITGFGSLALFIAGTMSLSQGYVRKTTSPAATSPKG